jgi:hypothetical protein
MAIEGIVPQAAVPVQSVPAPLQVQPMQAPQQITPQASSVQSQPWYAPAAQSFQSYYNALNPVAEQILSATVNPYDPIASTDPAYAAWQDANPYATPNISTFVPSAARNLFGVIGSPSGGDTSETPAPGPMYGPPAPNATQYNGGIDQGPQTASPGPYADTQPIPATLGAGGNLQEIGGSGGSSTRVISTNPYDMIEQGLPPGYYVDDNGQVQSMYGSSAARVRSTNPYDMIEQGLPPGYYVDDNGQVQSMYGSSAASGGFAPLSEDTSGGGDF